MLSLNLLNLFLSNIGIGINNDSFLRPGIQQHFCYSGLHWLFISLLRAAEKNVVGSRQNCIFFNVKSISGIHLKTDNCCISPYS